MLHIIVHHSVMGVVLSCGAWFISPMVGTWRLSFAKSIPGIFADESFVNDRLINEKGLKGPTTSDCQLGLDPTQKVEKTSLISEESQTDHRVLPQLLGWLVVKIPV